MSSPLQVEQESKPKRARKSPFRRAPGRPPEHGGRMLVRALRGVRIDSIDGRSQIGCALKRLREDMLADLGGEGEVTAAQRVLIEEAAKARVIAAAVGDWVLRQESLIADGELLPAVVQHQALVANLGRLLERLGLERKAKRVQSLDEYLAQHASTNGAHDHGAQE